jgi:hypothetical protein
MELLDLDGVLDLRRLGENPHGVQPVRDFLGPRVASDGLDAQRHRFIKGSGGHLDGMFNSGQIGEGNSTRTQLHSAHEFIIFAFDSPTPGSILLRRPNQSLEDAEWIDSECLGDLQELDDVEPALAALEL